MYFRNKSSSYYKTCTYFKIGALKSKLCCCFFLIFWVHPLLGPNLIASRLDANKMQTFIYYFPQSSTVFGISHFILHVKNREIITTMLLRLSLMFLLCKKVIILLWHQWEGTETYGFKLCSLYGECFLWIIQIGSLKVIERNMRLTGYMLSE